MRGQCGVWSWRHRLQVVLFGAVVTVSVGLPTASAADVVLAGTIGPRAILVVNEGVAQVVAVGASTREGVRLLSIRDEVAVIEFGGIRQSLRFGDHTVHQTIAASESLRLSADAQGHFWLSTRFNGSPMQRSVVDTGATLVSMGQSVAREAGIDYRKGEEGVSLTANGPVRVWRVRIDTLEFGGVVVHNVEAAVHESELPVVLLGMSLLNRFHWERDANVLVLRKRY